MELRLQYILHFLGNISNSSLVQLNSNTSKSSNSFSGLLTLTHTWQDNTHRGQSTFLKQSTMSQQPGVLTVTCTFMFCRKSTDQILDRMHSSFYFVPASNVCIFLCYRCFYCTVCSNIKYSIKCIRLYVSFGIHSFISLCWTQ